MSIAIAIFIINGIIFNSIDNVKTLIALPTVEDNDILKAGGIIKNTTNQLFSTLKFQGKKGNPDLKRLSLIHTYLVSLSLKDHSSLTEVGKLTRVSRTNNSSVDEYFIKILTEIIDDGDETNDKDETEDNIWNYVNNYVQNLDYMLQFYSKHNPQWDVKFDIMKYFENKVKENSTAIPAEEGDRKDELETWKPNTRRIFMGKRTKIKRFPFMASVEIFGRFTCSGSIIHNDLVITAASCLQLAWNNRFYRENPAFLSVRIGSSFFESGGEKVEVLEVYFHPSYEPSTLHNNLAIMRLLRKIHFSKPNRKRVMKIEFDTQDHALPNTAEDIYVIGWGAKTSSNMVLNAWEQRLSFDTMGVYGLEDCQDVYSKEYVTKKHFCAGYVSRGGGACNRDVGGPGVVDGVLTGVISFGSPVCGAIDSPTVFTKVGFYADWIEDIIEQEVPSQRPHTTTPKSFDPELDFTHAEVPTEKAQMIYRNKRKSTEYPNILRNQNHSEVSSESSYDEHKTSKLAIFTATNKIYNGLRTPATEIIPRNSTVISNFDPDLSDVSSTSSSESVELRKKISTAPASEAIADRKELEDIPSLINDKESKLMKKHKPSNKNKQNKGHLKLREDKPNVKQKNKAVSAGKQMKHTNNDLREEKLTKKETRIKKQSYEESEESAYDENELKPKIITKSKVRQSRIVTDKTQINTQVSPQSNEYADSSYNEDEFKPQTLTKTKIQLPLVDEVKTHNKQILSQSYTKIKSNKKNYKPQTLTKSKIKQLPIETDMDQPSTESQETRNDEDDETLQPVEKIKQSQLKSDNVVLTLTYNTDKESKRADFGKQLIGIAKPVEDYRSSASDDEDIEEVNNNAEGLSLFDKQPSFPFKHRSNTTLQSILTNEDILEILSEALKENLNISLPIPTTKSEIQKSFRVERAT